MEGNDRVATERQHVLAFALAGGVLLLIDRKSARLLQSHSDLVCRLLLEKKHKKKQKQKHHNN